MVADEEEDEKSKLISNWMMWSLDGAELVLRCSRKVRVKEENAFRMRGNGSG